MRKKTRRITIGIVILMIFTCLVYSFLRDPCAHITFEDVDLNSGEIRTFKYICMIRVKNEINTTRFSREVRRVGINIPDGRIWKRIRTEEGLIYRTLICYEYGSALADCIQATLALELDNVPDEERKVILQEMLENLRAGKLDEIKEEVKALSSTTGMTDDNQSTR